MRGLRIESLKLAHAGVIAGTLDLGAFDEGITLITGPNETGKSTVVEMVRAALFEKHSAKHQGLKALQPHGTKAAPEVWLNFRLGQTQYKLHKRFLEHPLAELTVSVQGQAPEHLVAAEADARVWSALSAAEPGRSGSKPSDMGAWGLLWVTQDAAAFSDPGAGLGTEAKVALQDAIGRQVSQVLGGRDSERIRQRVKEEYARYWTEARQQPTGQLAAALGELEAATQRVNRIEAAVLQVQEQAQNHEELVGRARGLEDQRAGIEAELEAAQREALALEGLKQEVALAHERLTGLTQQRESAGAAVGERARQALQLRALCEEREATEAVAGSLAEQLVELHGALEAVDTACTEQEAARADATEAWRHSRRRWDAARAAAGRAEARQALQEAKDLQARADELEAKLQGALPEAEWARLSQLREQVAEAEAELRHAGTRLTVQSPDGSESVFAVGRRSALSVPGVGQVWLSPAEPGLSAARTELEAAERGLQQELRDLGVEDVPAVGVGRRAREADERRFASAEEDLLQLAPQGLAALTVSAEAVRHEVQSLALRADQAAGLHEEAERLRAACDENLVTEAVWERIEARARTLEHIEAAREAAATRLTVRLHGPVALTKDGAPCAPDADGRVQFTLTQATDIRIGDAADLRVEPGGAGLEDLGARHEVAEAELAQALKEAGAPSVETARGAARQRREQVGLWEVAQSQLRGLAPGGLAALLAERARAEAKAQTQLRDLERAERKQEELQAARLRVEASPFTAQALERVELRQAQREAAEGRVLSRAAELRILEVPHACPDVTSGEVMGLRWTVVPGEGGADSHSRRDRLQLALDEALAAAEAVDLEAAKARWQQGLTWASTLLEVQRNLRARAPQGIEALEAAAQLDLDAEAVEPGEVEAREAEMRAAEAVVEACEARLRDARSAHAQALARHAAHERALGEANAKLGLMRRTEEEVATRLEAARQARDDAQLAEDLKLLEAAQAAQAQRHAQLQASLQAHNPDLVDGDVQRARRARTEHEAQVRKLRDGIAGLEALLASAGAEGQYEALSEAEVERAEAQRRCARVQRDADAAKALFLAVELRYTETQRRFLAPVVQQAKPYLEAIRPGTQLMMTPELAVDKLVRAGAEESFDRLSGGTREQLSVIVRLALARVLAKDGTPMPLILDDTMGWTDDGRFLQMTRILRNAARELQLIILTCHPGRFARLDPGRTIDLEALRKAAVGAP